MDNQLSVIEPEQPSGVSVFIDPYALYRAASASVENGMPPLDDSASNDQRREYELEKECNVFRLTHNVSDTAFQASLISLWAIYERELWASRFSHFSGFLEFFLNDPANRVFNKASIRAAIVHILPAVVGGEVYGTFREYGRRPITVDDVYQIGSSKLGIIAKTIKAKRIQYDDNPGDKSPLDDMGEILSRAIQFTGSELRKWLARSTDEGRAAVTIKMAVVETQNGKTLMIPDLSDAQLYRTIGAIKALLDSEDMTTEQIQEAAILAAISVR